MTNTTDFKNVMKIVSDILKQNGTEIDENKYDGLIIKELTETDFYKENRKNPESSGQTHIAILKKQRDIFPYIKASGYFNIDGSDSSLKKYFFIRIPINLAVSNFFYLEAQGKEIKPIDLEDRLIHSYTSIYCGQKDGEIDRMQMGLETKDGSKFKSFRNLLFEEHNPYLFILKIKEKFEYDIFAVLKKSIDGYDLSEYTKDFFKLNTETPIDSTKIKSLNCHLLDFAKREGVGENKLLYGVPGSGKSQTIEDEYCDEKTITERVLFHPDYTYSDFIGQILPKISQNNQIEYKFTPGPFTSILKEAYQNPKQKYILIIEEINRGNAPAIFGDIFQLLDRKMEIKQQNDDNFPVGTSKYEIANSYIADIVYGDKEHPVRIPANLSIIASMNTSDQNVFTLDTAFQRRWSMKLIPNSFDDVDNVFKNTNRFGSKISWKTFCERINEIILDENSINLSSEDKRLGVYFVNEKELNEREKFSEKVLKYLWDDAFKFNRGAVFKKKYKSLEDVILDFNDNNKNCWDVFNDGLFDTRMTYETNPNQDENND